MPESSIKSNLIQNTKNNSYMLKQIDACVSCGLCLNTCPTYNASHIEAESPRGRLSIIQGLLKGTIELDRFSFSHLDNCLMCGACDRHCPANVEYTAVMEQTKHWLNKKGFNSFYDRLFSWLVFRPWRLKWLAYIISFYRLSGLQKLLPITTLKAFPQFKVNPHWKEAYSIEEGVGSKGNVYLFKGCVASVFDQDTIESSIAMLNLAGFNVLFPENQVCCGSVASHSGDKGRQAILCTTNHDVFGQNIPIIVTSSGCFNYVKEFSREASKVYDVMDFLNQHLAGKLKFSNKNCSEHRTAISHTPCSLLNRPESSTASLQLLETINGHIMETDGIQGCCGSAGTYMYRHKKLSANIASPVVKQIKNSETEVVLTQNIGCRMQLMAQTGKTTDDVMHPVTWLKKNR